VSRSDQYLFVCLYFHFATEIAAARLRQSKDVATTLIFTTFRNDDDLFRYQSDQQID